MPTNTPRRPVGRPAMLPASHRLTVNLTADQIATAQRLGNGNLSAGVRAALDRDALLRGLPWPDPLTHADTAACDPAKIAY